MKIAIIGAGNVGGALAQRWVAAKHEVVIGARNPQSQSVIELLKHSPSLPVYSIVDAAAWADVLLIAATPPATLDIADQLQGKVNGKIIIDAMNSVRTRPEPFVNTYEALATLLPEAELVKCFNSTGFENMADPNYGGTGIDMFAAGDSPVAKAVANQLAKDAGFEHCYDFGGKAQVALLEQFALAWINLAIFQKMGRDMAFKLIRRPSQ